jgi:quinol monooxygenase YgiN
MIIRIVRMTFQPQHEELFMSIFERSKEAILSTRGCIRLELWRDINAQNVFVTHSHWESEDALNVYRDSEFFRNVWGQTKGLFSEKPLAFSVVKVDEAG